MADIKRTFGHGAQADMRTSPYIGMSAVLPPGHPEGGEGGSDGLFGTSDEGEIAIAKASEPVAEADVAAEFESLLVRVLGTPYSVETARTRNPKAVANPAARAGRLRSKRKYDRRLARERRRAKRLAAEKARADYRREVHARFGTTRVRSGYDAVRRKGRRGWHELYDRMEAGRWYARCDVLALVPDWNPGTVSWWLGWAMLRAGAIERAANPDAGRRLPHPKGREYLECGIMPHGAGKWLYRRVEGVETGPGGVSGRRGD